MIQSLVTKAGTVYSIPKKEAQRLLQFITSPEVNGDWEILDALNEQDPNFHAEETYQIVTPQSEDIIFIVGAQWYHLVFSQSEHSHHLQESLRHLFPD
jgi:hypothetical protein